MDILEYIKECCACIECKLDALVPQENGKQQQLFAAARYSLLGAGKRLRPVLAISTAETLGSSKEAAVIPACALEMIHTYSLIHDDLPCMDNDDFRRGKPSLHKAFSEGHAVLAGDFLLTYAFEILAKATDLSAEKRLQLVDILSRRSGGHEGMIAGQVMDIEAENKAIDLCSLKQIHRNKTGAMLIASIEFGAVVAGASASQMKILQQFGDEIGLAYQIVDDILDVTASEQKHGKTISSDAINNKTTYVSLLGLQESKILAEKISYSAKELLKQLDCDTTLLAKLADLFVNRKL